MGYGFFLGIVIGAIVIIILVHYWLDEPHIPDTSMASTYCIRMRLRFEAFGETKNYFRELTAPDATIEKPFKF